MKEPELPLSLSEFAPPPDPDERVESSILEHAQGHEVLVLHEKDAAAGIDVPSNRPRGGGFIATVEWPLRPGDTRIEALFIGTNRSRTHWFLWQCTMNDLVPFYPKYLERQIVALMQRPKLSKQDAAILMLLKLWEFERDIWFWASFSFVSCSGLLSPATVHKIGDRIWPDEAKE
jgi:hypothetical protein